MIAPINDSKFWKVGGLYQYDCSGIYSIYSQSVRGFENDLFICIAFVPDRGLWSDTIARLANTRTCKISETRMSASMYGSYEDVK